VGDKNKFQGGKQVHPNLNRPSHSKQGPRLKTNRQMSTHATGHASGGLKRTKHKGEKKLRSNTRNKWQSGPTKAGRSARDSVRNPANKQNVSENEGINLWRRESLGTGTGEGWWSKRWVDG